MKRCKYYNPAMDDLKYLCDLFYAMPDCQAGGFLHIMLDDDNIDDDSILYCLKECYTNPNHPSSILGAVICMKYLGMTMEERWIFDWYKNGNNLECPGECSNCDIAGFDWE